MKRWLRHTLGITALLILVGMAGSCTSSSNSNGTIPDDGGQVARQDEKRLLDDTFRIDIQEIDVRYRLMPVEMRIEAVATVRFRMREGQSRAVIHFQPAITGTSPDQILLDGEEMDLNNAEDIVRVSFEGTTQRALEFQRELSGSDDHQLTFAYELPFTFTQVGPSFYTQVNDTIGRGNEYLFPTINSPEELAIHHITFQVQGDINYRCIGSGLVTRTDNVEVQEWTLDTRREISSYTLMFALMPEAITVYGERNISGVPVRVMAYTGGVQPVSALDQLEQWIPELQQNLGPFPMPDGVSIFLNTSGGGMEYYGGTFTSLRALNHEVFHMYFGCSTVALTYRDSWWDEAINMWYEYSADPDYQPISEDFSSNMVSRYTPISLGFDMRAYDEGARIMQAVAVEMGGRQEMIDFLAYVHENHMFQPFNTWSLVDFIEAYSGADMEDRFLNWLYNGTRTYYAANQKQWTPPLHRVDMTPPASLLETVEDR